MKYSLFTLELFLCASKNKSLAKTAMEKNLVVSAVSKRISDLEKEKKKLKDEIKDLKDKMKGAYLGPRHEVSYIENNLKFLKAVYKEKTSSEIQGVLKAFSYGLEIHEVVEVIDEHVSCYSVMSIDEAILVRNESTKPILLLQGVYDLDEYEKVLKYDLDIVIHSDWQLKNLDARLKNKRFLNEKMPSRMF